MIRTSLSQADQHYRNDDTNGIIHPISPDIQGEHDIIVV
jgi:hypothetical protein